MYDGVDIGIRCTVEVRVEKNRERSFAFTLLFAGLFDM